MAQKKDQEKSKDQILKDKMRLQVMLPIILGVLTASIVISLIIFFSAPRWIQQVETNSMQVEGQNLKSLASSAGYVAQVLFQKVANDMLALNNILTLSINNVLQLNPAIQNDTTYFVGAKQFSENANDIFSTMPGYNSTNNKSLLRTTWFAVGPQENVDPFNDGGYSALPVTYQTYYAQWLSLLPMVNTLLDPSVYLGFYSPFDSADSGAQGLYCVYPIKASYSQYVKYTSTSDTDTFFTYKTRPYYKQATLPGNLAGTVEFIYPYLFVGGGQMGYTACINVLITSNQRILVCLDYLPDAIQEFIATAASQKNATYFVIERSTFRIIMYPNVTSILNQNLTNITQAEFGQNILSTQEAYDFDANFRSFMANFDEESNFAMNFTMNDNDYILSLSIFQVLVSNNPNVAPSEYAVGLIIPLAAMKAEFSALEQNIRTPILIQIGILLAIVLTLSFVAHIMIGWVSKAITAPISKLVLLLRKIENPDDGEEEEEGKSKRLEVILKWIPHIESLSSELTELHKRFTLIKASFQYTKEAETALNDGDAIIKYSQALNIHKQLENVRGIGMVYNSIGNIHFKHGNYQEASRFYEQAISNSEEELAGFESFMRNKDQKKVSDGSSLAKVLKRSSSSHMFSTDILDKVKAEFEELHSNRLYFLAQTMLAMGQRKKLASVSAVERIRELLTQVVKYDREGKRNPYRIIICLLDIAATHLTIIDSESYNNAEMEMNEANGRLKIYEEDTLQGYEDELSQDYRIPSFVLRQKYHCTMGSFLLKIGMKRDACKHFTDAIEHGKVYDPIIRQICLKHLETIFEEYGLLSRAPNIQKIMYTSTKKNKDIVILLDYSQSMGEGKRINVAISNILKMFDKYIQPDDRMGFIRFNMNCDVVFSIIEKKKNTIFLRKNIEESIKPSGGTALYNAIYEGLKMLTRAEPKNHAKWIIALTDGEDNESRIRYEQLERKVARSDVNLIIIGLELQESNKPKLSKLCRQTSNGLFIESTSNEDLNVAFQVLSDIIYGSNVNVEKIPI